MLLWIVYLLSGIWVVKWGFVYVIIILCVKICNCEVLNGSVYNGILVIVILFVVI